MSWGYWGIVTGLLTLLAVFFVCIEIMCRTPKTSAVGRTQSRDDNREGYASDTKHAA